MIGDKIYYIVHRLRRTASRNDKEQLLMSMRNSPTFKRVLFQTYSPYIRYHIRKIPDYCVGQGVSDLSESTWSLLHKLSLRKLTGTAARETLFEHIESLTPASAQLLKLIVAKDLKCGIAVNTINRVFPNLIPVFECQGVNDFDEGKTKWPQLVGPKIDCVRGEYRAGGFFTRRGHKITGLEHIVRYLSSIGKHVEFSGELFIPGMDFHRASGIIRSNKPTKGNVKFAAFDMPSLNTLPYDRRYQFLSKTLFPYGSKPMPEAVYIPHHMVDNMEQATVLFKKWVGMGFEGLVAKDPNGFIKAGKLGYDWWRLVNGISAEYRVINVYESDEVPNTLGGVIIEGNIRVGSGFVEDERKKYWGNPDLVVGKMATIVAKEKTAAGSLRQPIWKGIRFDL